MYKNAMAALVIAAFALAPLTAFAWADKEEAWNYCNQEAKEKGIAAEKVANCVATNWKDEEEIEGEEEKSE